MKKNSSKEQLLMRSFFGELAYFGISKKRRRNPEPTK
jgi:hypothetical protein